MSSQHGSSLLQVALALITVAGSLGGAWITTGKAFDERIQEKTVEIESLRETVLRTLSQAKLVETKVGETQSGIALLEERLRSLPTRLASGSTHVGGSSATDWTLRSGSGERRYQRHIAFPEDRFAATPAVVVAFQKLDVFKDTNFRASTTAENITKSGFDVVVATWGDTQVWSASVAWIAYGQ